jgi:hypothetical protein
MLEIRRAEEHGVGRTDWLDARIRFSFGPYQDPEQVGFSDLRLLNDDRVKGGGGFAEHAHQDTEVFSYVVEGTLAHKDSMGYGSSVKPGEVLTMSAGTGITHSEFNGSPTEPVRFLQIWMAPDRKGVAPRYSQRFFAPEEKRGRLRLIISPDGADGSLPFYQDTRIYAGLFDGAESATLPLGDDRYAYVQVVRGEISLNGSRIKEGDGVKVRHEPEIRVSEGFDAEVLVFDLRPQELPPA